MEVRDRLSVAILALYSGVRGMPYVAEVARADIPDGAAFVTDGEPEFAYFYSRLTQVSSSSP